MLSQSRRSRPWRESGAVLIRRLDTQARAWRATWRQPRITYIEEVRAVQCYRPNRYLVRIRGGTMAKLSCIYRVLVPPWGDNITNIALRSGPCLLSGALRNSRSESQPSAESLPRAPLQCRAPCLSGASRALLRCHDHSIHESYGRVTRGDLKPLVTVECAEDEDHRTKTTVEAHAKKHPAGLQGALGFLGFDGFAMESVAFPHHK
ncbi:unnamed protein product [Prorocentrum cordatum]|uniref:Uncharacterized protein n=1 Tax=Prorocentrum cordatum TaxID=2364126 RepID=A0ABN9VJR8_9DINO|nr:unnamed protein product [Polarella glacialis]